VPSLCSCQAALCLIAALAILSLARDPIPYALETRPGRLGRQDPNLCIRIRAADPTSFRIEMRKFESCPRLRVSVN
jgi:hypothetical protein